MPIFVVPAHCAPPSASHGQQQCSGALSCKPSIWGSQLPSHSPGTLYRAPVSRDALEVKGRPQRRLGRRLEEVAKAVGGGYFRLQIGAGTGRQGLGIGWEP